MDAGTQHSREAEESLLGAIMLTAGECLAEVQDVISVDDLFLASSREVYLAACDLDGRGKAVDAVTVSDWLHAAGRIDEAGGDDYIVRVVENCPSARNVRAYSKIIRSHSIRRQLTLAGREVVELSASPVDDVEQLLSSAQEAILSVNREVRDAGPRLVGESVGAWVDNLDRRSSAGHEISGISTGFRDLDRKINGLQRGNLIVIAGRPSMGKSAIATNIMHHVSQRLPCLMFTLEMTTDEVVTRLVSQVGKVPVDRLMAGNLDETQWERVRDGVDKISRTRALLDESPSLLLSQLRARARRAMHTHGRLGMVVVDYLQLMGSESAPRTSRAEQIAELTRGLKMLAKELDAPVIALSQLNREVDKRVNKRPILSDLRDSGGIEQDADLVLFMYRDVVYNASTAHKKVAEVIVGKQRNGPVGTVLLYFFEALTMFGQMETSDQQGFWNDRYRGSRDDDFDEFK